MAGTIPTVVDYGVQLLNPTIFFVTTAAICAVVGLVTGSRNHPHRIFPKLGIATRHDGG